MPTAAPDQIPAVWCRAGTASEALKLLVRFVKTVSGGRLKTTLKTILLTNTGGAVKWLVTILRFWSFAKKLTIREKILEMGSDIHLDPLKFL